MTRSVFTEEYRLFRKILKQERLKAKLSQQVLAKKLNRPANFVSRYELGERRLDVIELIEIAHAIGFKASKLVEKLEKLEK